MLWGLRWVPAEYERWGSLSGAITDAQIRYIRWLAKKVRCPVPFPESISDVEACWLIRDLRMRLARKRAYMLIQ